MKKLTLLLGSLGGALAGYALSNKKLRKELMEAPDAQAAAKILGKHLSSDGEQVAKEVKHLAQVHEVDKKIAEGKKYVKKYYDKSAKEVKKMVDQATKEAKKMIGKAKKNVKKSMHMR